MPVNGGIVKFKRRPIVRESKLTPLFNIIILNDYMEFCIIFGLRETSNYNLKARLKPLIYPSQSSMVEDAFHQN